MKIFRRYEGATMFSLEEIVRAFTHGELSDYEGLSTELSLNVIYSLYLTNYFSANALPFYNDETNSFDSMIDEVFRLFYSRFSNHGAIIIEDEKIKELNMNNNAHVKMIVNWFKKLLNSLALSWDYYSTILKEYRNAKDLLMQDVKATTKALNYFNDTPQAQNVNGIFEGDDYISTFSKNLGESSSPLNSKIMRLKEIQENYKMLLREWSNSLEELIYEEDC